MLIVYHSQSGRSALLAAAVYHGALDENKASRLLRAVDAGAADVAASSGLVLVCAENSGRLAGGAKDFMDRVFYPLIDRSCTLPYTLLISAGNDGRGAVQEAQRILRGVPFTEALEPRIILGPPTAHDLSEARELGSAFAAGLAMGIF
ncbi:MAG: hypothetical protein ACI87W_000152 [Halieaceae bacterium]